MTRKSTALDSLHRELNARMVPFAGYAMPLQYPSGIIREHLHTRAAAGLFDVSHMGQLVIEGPGIVATLESLVPADLKNLAIDSQTYTLFTNAQGGVLDDLIITRWGEEKFFLVVNAACKTADIAYLRTQLSADQRLQVLEEQALLALQGPAARAVMQTICPAVATLTFLRGRRVSFSSEQSKPGVGSAAAGASDRDIEAYVTCSGYTGEDGFEVSLAASQAVKLARQLLADERVAPVGLGARDSLRLEAGLCLYGHELSATVDPIQAGLLWAINKARRIGGDRAGGFPGAAKVFEYMAERPPLLRVGLSVEGRRPVREGQLVVDDTGGPVGEVSSAAYGASVGGPIAMAFIQRELATAGNRMWVDVRGKQVPVTVTKMPFVPQRYFRG